MKQILSAIIAAMVFSCGSNESWEAKMTRCDNDWTACTIRARDMCIERTVPSGTLYISGSCLYLQDQECDRAFCVCAGGCYPDGGSDGGQL